MSVSLLVESYLRLPQPRPGDDPDLLHAGMQEAMREFRQEARAKYTEGTLQRLLADADAVTRRAAALALGFLGTMRSNRALAEALRDPDALVRKFAADSVWEVWYRGDAADHGWQLRQAMGIPDHAQALAALDDLIRDAADFAEAYNQRAILYFRRSEYARAVADCEAVLRLNPFHFGAAAGMGHSYLRMNRPRAALRAFQHALEINPGLDNLRDMIRELLATLGEREAE